VGKNHKDELIPTRIQSEWRVYIDYRNLNSATIKDHFLYPFLDQMLERLARRASYCFLDGYSSYTQIQIAPKDQEKTTFTCPFGMSAVRKMRFSRCNAPTTFQGCISIFFDLIEQYLEIFMDDFPVYGDSFKDCFTSLGIVLQRYLDKHLTLN